MAALAALMVVVIRGPFAYRGTSWIVYHDGYRVPGRIGRDGEKYRIHLEGMHHSPLPPFATLDEAAQALVDYHAGR